MLQIVAKDLVSSVSNNAPKILGAYLLACWVWKPTQMQIPTSMLPSSRNCRVHTERSAQRFCDLALRYWGPVLILWCGTVAVILDFDMSNTLIFRQHARVCCSNFCCICIIIQDYAIIALCIQSPSTIHCCGYLTNCLCHAFLILPPIWPPPNMSSFNPVHTCM